MLLINYEKSENFKMKQVVLDEEILINLDTNCYLESLKKKKLFCQ